MSKDTIELDRQSRKVIKDLTRAIEKLSRNLENYKVTLPSTPQGGFTGRTAPRPWELSYEPPLDNHRIHLVEHPSGYPHPKPLDIDEEDDTL